MALAQRNSSLQQRENNQKLTSALSLVMVADMHQENIICDNETDTWRQEEFVAAAAHLLQINNIINNITLRPSDNSSLYALLVLKLMDEMHSG